LLFRFTLKEAKTIFGSSNITHLFSTLYWMTVLLLLPS